MTVTRLPLPCGDLRTLATRAIPHLPIRHGLWRVGGAPERPDGAAALVIRDEVRRVLVTADARSIAVQAWPANGATAPPATAVESRDATGRTLALAIARDHLGPQHPAPFTEAQSTQQELRAATAVAGRAPAGAFEVSVSQTDRWYTVSWRLGRERRVRVRIDGPERVQTEVGGLSLNALSVALGTVLVPSGRGRLPGADGFAATWLINRHPTLWHDPLSSGSGPDDVLLGPGAGRVTVAVQVPDDPPTDRTRGTLTVETDLDLAFMLLDTLS
ncbi:hypothetical protein ACFRKE_29195 [Kitasatospora indigofera]|uniref:hypothetical protein n=1 Tax=Kitasatospora indigofera TaxID=67307 RepID=UPI0036AD37F8